MRAVLGTIGALAAAAILGAVVFVYSGAYDIAATDPHWPVTYKILKTLRSRSVAVRAADIVVPGNLGDQARIVAGTSHFVTHCAECHSAPGVAAEDLAEGMYPKPPVLTQVASRRTPAELFWILKHGIKMSGMPAWGDHGDPALWNIVAFLEHLPDIDARHYAELVRESAAAGGHHKHGEAAMGGMDMSAHDWPQPRP